MNGCGPPKTSAGVLNSVGSALAKLLNSDGSGAQFRWYQTIGYCSITMVLDINEAFVSGCFSVFTGSYIYILPLTHEVVICYQARIF